MTAATTTARRPRAATPAATSPAAPDLPDKLLAVLKRMRLPYLRNAAPEVLATARAQRVRSKMTAALELAALVGTEPVDAALGVAAAAGRFAEGDLLAIVEHRANGASIAALVVADEDHSVQPGTSAWATFGTHPDIDNDLAAEETP